MLLNVDGGEDILANESLADDDRVFVVVTLPRHVGHDHVLAERELALIGGHGVGNHLARCDAVAHHHRRAVVEAGPLVRANELQQDVAIEVLLAGRLIWLNNDQVCGNGGNHTRTSSNDHLAGVARRATLNASANDWGVRLEERHRLTHHVRTHQRAVCVVMLKERNQRRSNGDNLLW